MTYGESYSETWVSSLGCSDSSGALVWNVSGSWCGFICQIAAGSRWIWICLREETSSCPCWSHSDLIMLSSCLILFHLKEHVLTFKIETRFNIRLPRGDGPIRFVRRNQIYMLKWLRSDLVWQPPLISFYWFWSNMATTAETGFMFPNTGLTSAEIRGCFYTFRSPPYWEETQSQILAALS